MNAQPADYVYLPGEHVLDRRGCPVPGYTLHGDALYARSRVRAAPWRLKEWDFYQISDGTLCLQLVVGHVSYAGNCNIALFNCHTGERLFEHGVTTPLPFRSMRMPESAHADSLLRFSHSGTDLSFETKDNARFLSARSGGFEAEIRLTPAAAESVLVCTPFAAAHDFYCNEKINLLKAECSVRIDGKAILFDPDRTFSLLDWGRGVWPLDHEWYWSSVSALLDGAPFGFNLGCGFGETEKARGTENVFYCGGSAHKLGRVTITREADVLRPWTIESEDGRLRAVLTPQSERDTVTKLLFVNNRCHQMFGTFEGKFILEGGETVSFSGIPGFAEHAVNHW